MLALLLGLLGLLLLALLLLLLLTALLLRLLALLLLALLLGLLGLLLLPLLLLLLTALVGLLALLLLALLLGLLALLLLLLPLFLGLLALLLLLPLFLSLLALLLLLLLTALVGLLALLLLALLFGLLALLLLALLLSLLALLLLLLTALLKVGRPRYRWCFRALLCGALGGRSLARRGSGRLTCRCRLRPRGGCRSGRALRGSRGACPTLELSAAAAIFFLGRRCSRLRRRDDLHIPGWRRTRCRGLLLRSCGRLGRPARIGRESCLAGRKCGRRRRRLGPGNDLALHHPRWGPA